MTRLEARMVEVGVLSENQFGFRRSRSTLDAIAEVLRLAQVAVRGPVQGRKMCVVVTLDVRNAFNSVPRAIMDEALQRASTPKYLIKTLRSYMDNRYIILGQGSGEETIPVRCGVPQGSVLGPTLWNLFYNCVLTLDLPESAKLIAFADDLEVVAMAHNTELLEDIVNPVLTAVGRWMEGNGLSLAPEKSECVVLTKKKTFREPKFLVDDIQVPVKRVIR